MTTYRAAAEVTTTVRKEAALANMAAKMRLCGGIWVDGRCVDWVFHAPPRLLYTPTKRGHAAWVARWHSFRVMPERLRRHIVRKDGLREATREQGTRHLPRHPSTLAGA
jgi:hypothetical protein